MSIIIADKLNNLPFIVSPRHYLLTNDLQGFHQINADWPPDGAHDFTSNDTFSDPLEIERRLEEELSALDAELAAAAEIISDQDAEPEAPASPRASKPSRKSAKKSAPVDDGDKDTPDAPVPSVRGSGKAEKLPTAPLISIRRIFGIWTAI